MNIEIELATPMQIMHDIGYLTASLINAGQEKLANDLENIAHRLAYYFELQRQEEI